MGSWSEGSGPPAPPPSQGRCPQAGCAPSFLRAPLCHHGKPPRGPVHSRSAPGRQGLLRGPGSGLDDIEQVQGCRMPLAWWGPRDQGRAPGSSRSAPLHFTASSQLHTPHLTRPHLPRMGRYAGEGALPASRRTPGSPGCARAAGLRPGPGLTLSRSPPAAPTPAPRHRHRRRPLRLRLALHPHPLPPGAQPPVPAPGTALGQLAASPSSRGRGAGVSLKPGSWGALPRTPRARGAQRG